MENIKMMRLDQWEINLSRRNLAPVDQGLCHDTVLGKEKGVMQEEWEVWNSSINSSDVEEGGTTIIGCDQSDASIQKEMQGKWKLLNLWELRERLDQSERILQVKIHNPKKMCRYYHKGRTVALKRKHNIIAEGTVYKSDGKIMLLNKEIPKDC
ncbi:hypothetical protein Tco_0898199 [Tanacetum coccineum]